MIMVIFSVSAIDVGSRWGRSIAFGSWHEYSSNHDDEAHGIPGNDGGSDSEDPTWHFGSADLGIKDF